jgi:tetratricopeptide (TPR) repeat protein
MAERSADHANPSVLRERGRALVEMRRYADAVAAVRQALAADPNDAEALRLLAQAQLGAERYENALIAADRSLAVEPDSEWGHRLRSVALRCVGRGNLAMEAAREAVRLAPSFFHGHRTLGYAALEAFHMPVARSAAIRVMELAPSEPDGYELMGHIALKEKKWAEAETMFRKVLALDPQSSTAHHNLGLALQAQNRWRQALRAYGEAARFDLSDGISANSIVQLMHKSPRARAHVVAVRLLVVPQVGVVLGGVLLLFLTVERSLRYVRIRRSLRGVLPPAALRHLDRRVRAVAPTWPSLALFLVAGVVAGVAAHDWSGGMTSEWPGFVIAVVVALGALVTLVRAIEARLTMRAVERP